MYECETLTMAKAAEVKLERKVLRKMLVHNDRQRFRIPTKEEFLELYKDPNIMHEIKYRNGQDTSKGNPTIDW